MDCRKKQRTDVASRFLVVRGIRYVVPYEYEQLYSVRLQNAGKPVALVLAEAFHRRSNDMGDTLEYFGGEVRGGRVQLLRHKRSMDDRGPFTASFAVVLDPDMPTERGDRLKIFRHVHERCTIYRGPLSVLYTSPDGGSIRAVFKPAGLPVVNEEGRCFGSVLGLAEAENYHLGHRLDLPVSGVLLLAKKGKMNALLKAMSPEGKRREGVLKAYVARVRGKMGEEAREMRVRLKWDNTVKKAVIVDDNEGRETVTRVTRMKWDEERGESVVRVELASGARHQIRAVLANMDLPIVGDVKYGGGGENVVVDEEEAERHRDLRMYADDDEGRLRQMLRRERVDWCDKCRWQLAEVESGGTRRGAERLADHICLLSYHYRIPSLGIDVCLPDHMIPRWARWRSSQ